MKIMCYLGHVIVIGILPGLKCQLTLFIYDIIKKFRVNISIEELYRIMETKLLN